MTAVDSSRRRPRAAWADTRLLLGLLLIGVSIAGVWFVVAAARQTVPVFAAARTIVPGEVVGDDDLRVVEVALGSSDAAYLAPGALTDGIVASRTIGAGELVPRSAVGDGASLSVTTVVVPSAAEVPASLGEGSAVEVWSAPRSTSGEFEAPRILVPHAVVAGVVREDSMMGGSAASLELVIPRAEVAETLAAVAQQAAVSVVPAAGSRR